jgi:hypothetical protein
MIGKNRLSLDPVPQNSRRGFVTSFFYTLQKKGGDFGYDLNLTGTKRGPRRPGGHGFKLI